MCQHTQRTQRFIVCAVTVILMLTALALTSTTTRPCMAMTGTQQHAGDERPYARTGRTVTALDAYVNKFDPTYTYEELVDYRMNQT